MSWLHAGPDGVSLRLVVQPRAGRTELGDVVGDARKVRVAAPPVDGAANDELVEFLARALGVPRSVVSVKAGKTGRRKTVFVSGLTANDVQERLCRD